MNEVVTIMEGNGILGNDSFSFRNEVITSSFNLRDEVITPM